MTRFTDDDTNGSEEAIVQPVVAEPRRLVLISVSVPSSSHLGDYHVVELIATCTCKGYENWQHCRHLTGVLNKYGLEAQLKLSIEKLAQERKEKAESEKLEGERTN